MAVNQTHDYTSHSGELDYGRYVGDGHFSARQTLVPDARRNCPHLRVLSRAAHRFRVRPWLANGHGTLGGPTSPRPLDRRLLLHRAGRTLDLSCRRGTGVLSRLSARWLRPDFMDWRRSLRRYSRVAAAPGDRKSTRLNSSHLGIPFA